MERFKFLAKDKIKNLPKTAGVYCFALPKHQGGSGFLYIGKASNIRERVRNHFLQSTYRDNLFINRVSKIGYIETGSTIEALILESQLIKKFQPKYNIVWRDDKNYFYVGITREELPRVFITHQAKLKIKNYKLKISYMGPFVDGKALKQTLKILRKIFPYYAQRKHPKNLCPWCHLGLCPGPNPDRKEYQKNIKNLIAVLKGEKQSVLRNLKKEMVLASKIQDYEKAAKFRDQISALENVLSHSEILAREIVPRTSTWYHLEIAEKLKEILNTKREISRIEAYDVSNIQGKQATGSMITFINGRPNKNFYRRFKIRISGRPNDTAMLKEVLSRRLGHREWPYPDLILIDGGIGQLNAAIEIKKSKVKTRALNALSARPSTQIRDLSALNQNYKSKFKIIALAKRNNELFIEGRKNPLLLKNLPREIFNLILQLRDEAHRFARNYHLLLREIDIVG